MEKIPNQILFRVVETVLKNGKQVKIRVAGRSMEPFLVEDRDIVILKPLTSDGLRRGDIVLFKTGEFYCLHRIIRIRKERITLCGDGIYQSTEIIPKSNILGILHSVVRPSGKVIACNSLGWKIKSGIWMLLYPFRRYLLYIYRKWCMCKKNRT